jgi:hypothetical protein
VGLEDLVDLAGREDIVDLAGLESIEDLIGIIVMVGMEGMGGSFPD